MSKKEAKLIYESMLKDGDLKAMFPDMTGDWLKDKKTFMQHYDVTQEFIEGTDDLGFDDYID